MLRYLTVMTIDFEWNLLYYIPLYLDLFCNTIIALEVVVMGCPFRGNWERVRERGARPRPR